MPAAAAVDVAGSGTAAGAGPDPAAGADMRAAVSPESHGGMGSASLVNSLYNLV